MQKPWTLGPAASWQRDKKVCGYFAVTPDKPERGDYDHRVERFARMPQDERRFRPTGNRSRSLPHRQRSPA